MNYEQKYNDALDLARTYHDGYIIQGHVGEAEILEDIFTELKESEDERIRKTLIGWVNIEPQESFGDGFTKEEILDWLEKQGEQPTDKVEPKFKVGDWVVSNNNGEVLQIGARYTEEGQRIYLSNVNDVMMSITLDELNNDYRLWTIADAKDGDVLATEDGRPFIIRCMVKSENDIPSAYCGINARYRFIITDKYNQDTSKWTNSKVHPATKEQCDILFEKMNDAGYEWDAEKKEVKKIEPKTLNADEVIGWLNDQACQGWIEDVEVDKFVDKFKKDFGL